MPACGYEFYLLVFDSISSRTREDKIHIHARSCDILYVCICSGSEPLTHLSVECDFSNFGLILLHLGGYVKIICKSNSNNVIFCLLLNLENSLF